jgi:hypothetical protein
MADITVTGLTATAMKAYRNAQIVSAAVRSNILYLKKADGTELTAGTVGGVQGPPGDITVSPAYGDLSGNYPSPTIRDGVITAAKIVKQTITDAEIWPANIDGVATKASLRTLGTGSQQAAAGNHTHTVSKITDLRIRAGLVTHTASAVGTKTTVVYTNVFPSGFFTAVPEIVITPDTGSPENIPYYSVLDRTLTGFSICSTRSTAATTSFHWIAMQNL